MKSQAFNTNSSNKNSSRTENIGLQQVSQRGAKKHLPTFSWLEIKGIIDCILLRPHYNDSNFITTFTEMQLLKIIFPLA